MKRLLLAVICCMISCGGLTGGNAKTPQTLLKEDYLAHGSRKHCDSPAKTTDIGSCTRAWYPITVQEM